jgi:hypothetical protein
MHALDDQWQNAFRSSRDFKFLNPTAQKVLKEKLGLNPDEAEGVSSPKVAPAAGKTVKMVAPDGVEIVDIPEEDATAWEQLGAKRAK